MNGHNLKFFSSGMLLGACLITPLSAGAATTTPTGLLKATMAKYASLHSFQARCLWSDVIQQHHAAPSSPASQDSRTISYQWPNRFKVITNVTNGFVMTAVSDGKHLVEFTNKDLTARQQYPAPASIDQAKTMQMQHPMFCGSLLYQFFGGPSKLPSLVNLDRQPIRFGSDRIVEGVKCRTVQFYGQQTYGNTTVAISLPDHLVREIVYDSEPLLAMVQKRMKLKQLSSTTTETYDRIVLNHRIQAAVFNTTPPRGVQTVVAAPPPDDKPPVPLGQMAPDFTVTSLKDGQPVKLSSLRGRLIMLDFWATWCPPCRESLPETQKISQQYGAHDLAVMTIDDEDAGTIQPFLNKNGYTFPAYRDSTNSAAKAFHVNAIPTVAVIDPQGRLVAYFVGLREPTVVLTALKKAGLSVNP